MLNLMQLCEKSKRHGGESLVWMNLIGIVQNSHRDIPKPCGQPTQMS